MARAIARLKMGFYPLPEREGSKLRSLLAFSEAGSVIDPCVGQGAAHHLVTSEANVHRYGIELDAERAQAASSTGKDKSLDIRLLPFVVQVLRRS